MGGLVSTQQAYHQVIYPLVEFIVIAPAFYAIMFIQKIPKSYEIAAFAVSASFAYLIASIDVAVVKNTWWEAFTLILVFIAVFVGLVVDWNAYNASPGGTSK